MTFFLEWQLLWLVSDLFIAGGETTITNLRWAILCLANFPEIQNRCWLTKSWLTMLDSIRRLCAHNVLHCPIWKPLFTKCSAWARSPECGGQLVKMQNSKIMTFPRTRLIDYFICILNCLKYFLMSHHSGFCYTFGPWATIQITGKTSAHSGLSASSTKMVRSEKTIIFWPSQLAKDNVLEKHLPAPKCSSFLQTFCKSTTCSWQNRSMFKLALSASHTFRLTSKLSSLVFSSLIQSQLGTN